MVGAYSWGEVGRGRPGTMREKKKGWKSGADRRRVLLNASVDQTSVNPEPIV